MKFKISPGEILATVPPSDGNFKAALKAASPEDLQAAIQIRHSTGHKGALKALADEVARRAVAEHGTPTASQIKNQESQIKNGEDLQVFSKDDPIGSLGRALENLGKSVTDEMIVQAWGAAQAAQEDFSLKRIRLGLYLWSVREVVKVKRGAWTKYLRHIAKIIGLKGDSELRQIYDLLAYAQRLVMVVAQGSTKSETLRLRMESLAWGERSALISLDLDSPAGQAALAKMVGKSSLRELIRDLNESAKTADEMVEAETKASKAEEAKKGAGEEESEAPAAPGPPEQIDFFAELFARPIGMLKIAYEEHCGNMSDDDILATESALQATLEVVSVRADEARQRQKEAQRQADIAKRKLLTGAT